MKLSIVDTETAARLKQLTWLAGRKNTANPKLRYVWLDGLGAAATDGYVAGWFPSQQFQGYLAHEQELRAAPGSLRTDLGSTNKVNFERVNQGIDLTKWLTLTAAEVITKGHKFQTNVRQLQDLLAAEQKKGRNRLALSLGEHTWFHIPTTKRALRQTKHAGELTMYTWNALYYWQDPKTKLELMVSGIHPKIDPEGKK